MADANTNFNEIVTTTLKKRRKRLADNVLNHNALLRTLNERGRVDPADGGETLVEELEYAENGNFMYYSGYETLSIAAQSVMSAAEYNWKQAACMVTASGEEMRKNNGETQMIRLLDRRIENAEKTMMNNLSVGVYSDGTGTGGKQIGGLQLLVADTPTSGTVGGIDRASFTFWQNFSYDATTDGGAAATSANIQGYMNTVWLNTLRGSDKPDLIVADTNYFTHYWESLQAIQRINQTTDGGSGFDSLTFHGPGGTAMVFYDDNVPADHMYFLNTDFLFWRPHTQANMEVLERREAVNQDALVVPVLFMGNLTMSNAARQGLLKD